MDIHIEYSPSDQVWMAGFIRDGEWFILDGKLAGAGGLPSEAVWDLVAEAHYLVVHGENAISNGPIDIADRIWLFKLLDQMPEENQARYAAMRTTLGQDPHTYAPTLRLLTPEEDLAVSMPEEIDPEQVVAPMTDDETYHLWDDLADQDPNNE